MTWTLQEAGYPGAHSAVAQTMELRQRLNRIRGKKPAGSTLAAAPARPDAEEAETDLAQFLGGEWKQDESGRTFRVERSMPCDQIHGRLRLDEIYRTDVRWLELLSGDPEFSTFDPEATLFLDTETTGLAGGSGTYVFLVGLGYFRGDVFRTDQLFLPDLDSEFSFLKQLCDRVRGDADGKTFRYLVTFNGKGYDLNLLEYRFLIHGIEPPFESLSHLDLLYPTRMLWKRSLQNCALQTVEKLILGLRRPPDIPSALIPRTYFTYLRSGYHQPFQSVFEHNRIDVLTMVGLLAVAVQLLKEPDRRFFVSPISSAQMLLLRGEDQEALRLLEIVSQETQWEVERPDLMLLLAGLKKKLGASDEALALFEELLRIQERPPLETFEEAAKILEHQKRDLEKALSLVQKASSMYPESNDLDHRKFRLQCRIAGEKWY